jgi:hypothetical protein
MRAIGESGRKRFWTIVAEVVSQSARGTLLIRREKLTLFGTSRDRTKFGMFRRARTRLEQRCQ